MSLSYKKIVKFLNVKEDSKGFGLSGENALHRSVINGESRGQHLLQVYVDCAIKMLLCLYVWSNQVRL